MGPTIDDVIAAIPDWAGASIVVEPIAAGLTNRNYRVVLDGTPCFVRIPGALNRTARGRSRQRAAQQPRRGGRGGRPACPPSPREMGRMRELCAAYFGEATPAMLARLRLQMIMSDVGWTLWAAIQARVSPIDYDFWGWPDPRQHGPGCSAPIASRFGGHT